jgi:hypothetical protein
MIARCQLEWRVGIALKTGITVIVTNSYNIYDLKLQTLQSIVTITQIWNYKHWNNTFTISHIATRRRLSVDPSCLVQLKGDPVVEPTHRRRSPLVIGVCASGGACTSVEPTHRWRISHADGAARRWRSPLTDGGARQWRSHLSMVLSANDGAALSMVLSP